MRKFINQLLIIFRIPKYSKWIDIGCFDVSGRYYLMQMQFNLKTNKKRFRRARMGWVNDSQNKPKLFDKSQSYNAKEIKK